MKKALKIIFWIIAFLLFPIIAGLYFIWPSKIFKDRMSKGWRKFWWVTYGFITVFGIVVKTILTIVFIIIACGDSGGVPYTLHEDFSPSAYRTSEDFYKLTGVEFPELEIVDSLFYNENCLRANHWWEYKFVVKDGTNDDFHKRLNRACKVDSTHWRYDKEDGIYRYRIHPDQHPVDRSRGMCDRIVTFSDGTSRIDWDGDFISVDIEKDTIVLQNGWLR